MLYRRLMLEWLLVLLAAGLVVAGANWRGWTRPVDSWLFEQATRLISAPVDDRILLVEIDNASIDRLGRWPWSRKVHRDMLDTLAKAGPAAVDYDVLLLEPSADDAGLAQAMRQAGRIYLPVLIDRGNGPGAFAGATNGGTAQGLTLPTPELRAAAADVGAAEVMLDEDGVLRRAEAAVPVGDRRIPQIVTQIALAQHATGATPDLPMSQEFLLRLLHKDSFRRISFAAIASGEVPPALLQGRLLLVGATADGLGDAYAVAPAAGGLMSGIVVQANILNTLLTDTAIHPAGEAVRFALCLIVLVLVMVAFLRLGPDAHLRLTLAAMAVSVAAAMALVPLAHVWLPPGPVLMGLGLAYTAWSWRRLAAMGVFLTREAAVLRADPGLSALAQPVATPGDPLQVEADQLHAIITQLRDLRRFIATVVERLPDATCVVNVGGRIVLANRAADALFGAPVTGEPLDRLIARACEGHPPEDGSLPDEILREDGRTLMVSEAPLGDGRRILRLADVTDLRRAADERAEMLQFLSHDLRSPNAAILMLLDGEQLGAAPRSSGLPLPLVERIRAYARQGLNLADDFVQLARARRRQITLEPVDLRDIAREAADMVWAKATARQVALSDISRDDDAWVMGDRSMLLRAAINLIDNAVKFAPEGAAVEYGVCADPQIGEMASLVVRGPGPPMPEGRRDNPFGLYGAGRNVAGSAGRGGTESIGLGLAFVEATALRHAGSAAYAYEDGYGARFTLSVPLAPSEE